MVSGYGIAGFVQGLVEGRNTRNRWDDRRRRHRFEDQRALREAERHRWAEDDQADVTAERRRQAEQRQRQDAAAQAAYQATVDARAPERTLGVRAMDPGAAAAPAIDGGRGITGAVGRSALIGQAGDDRLRSGGGQMARGRSLAEQRGAASDGPEGIDLSRVARTGQNRRAYDRLADRAAVEPAPTQAAPAPSTAAPADAGMAPGHLRAEDREPTALTGATGRDGPMARPRAPDTLGVTTPSGTPAASLGVLGAVERTAGRAGGAPRRRPEESFLETYMRVGVPHLVEHFLRTGQIDRARTFGQWVRDENVQRGMQAWARATAAAARGDERGFLHNLITAYNTDGYFEDGREVIEGQSGLLRDEDGTITGARLTFRDLETGDTFEQVFDGIDDIYRVGIQMLAPERVLEFGLAEIEAGRAAEAARLERLAEENEARRRANEALELEGVRHLNRMELEILRDRLETGQAGGDPRERYQELRETILEGNAGLGPIAPEDLDAQIRALMEAEDRAMAYFEQTGSLPSPAAGNPDYRLR